MKEKLLEVLKISTYYPRKLFDLVLFHFFYKWKNDWSILEDFKNRPVLIAGNGPSLNETPLDKVPNKFVSIGMNKINLLFPKINWRPDIITCVNGFVINQNKDFFNSTDCILILPIRCIYLGIKPRKNILFVNLKDQFKIEAQIDKVLSTGCTVTFTALQIAAYLNPKSVNIVGVDHSFKYNKGSTVQKYKGNDVNHFSKDYFKNQYWGLPDLEGSEKLYKIAKNYFDKLRIPIKDLTVDGKLEIFEKGNVSELIE
jgi:hypothetical protein